MDEENEFEIRPGRLRARSIQRQRPFIAQALAAAQKAGATLRNGGLSRKAKGFGRGRRATLIANRLLTQRSRLAVIKARVVRHRRNPNALTAHLRYLQREGVTQDREKAVLFGRDADQVDRTAFADTCADDRHHFRFIISPEDATELADIRQFTRDLMRQAETDLGTKLDWVGVAHWNTEHPHVHVILRGKTDLGEDLVISRDYIREGMRARAQTLLTDELGPRTDVDIRKSLHRQIEVERFTQLDRQLLRDACNGGYVDLAPKNSDPFQVLKAGRIRKLEALGLAEQFAPGQWVLAPETEETLRALGERGDIIKRIHRALRENETGRSSERLAWGQESLVPDLTGRLLDRGLDDELKGTAYAVIDGVDGRTHHLSLPSLEATTSARPGAIVTLRRATEDRPPRLVVASDLDLKAQVDATGPTWLDRSTMDGSSGSWARSGFGAEAREAQSSRLSVLADRGLAKYDGGEARYPPDLVNRLEIEDYQAVCKHVSERFGRSVLETAMRPSVAGRLVERVDATARRYALLDTGQGLQLVPWSPALSDSMGEWVTGQKRANGSIAWDISRSRGIEIPM